MIRIRAFNSSGGMGDQTWSFGGVWRIMTLDPLGMSWGITLDSLGTHANDNNQSCSACNGDFESKEFALIRAEGGKLWLFPCGNDKQQRQGIR